MRRLRARIMRGHLPAALDYYVVNLRQFSRIDIRRRHRASMMTRNAAHPLLVHRSVVALKRQSIMLEVSSLNRVRSDGCLSRGSSVMTERACSRLSNMTDRACSRLSDMTDRACSRMSDFMHDESSEPPSPPMLINGPPLFPSKSPLPESHLETVAGQRAEQRLQCLSSKHSGFGLNFGCWEGVPKDKLQISRRSIIVHFIDHLREDFSLDPEVTTFAVSYMDRFLCDVASRGGFEQRRTELLGLVCLMLASKFKEIMSPSIDGLLQAVKTQYAREEFKAMEVEVLVALGWSLDSPSPRAALENLLVVLTEHHSQDFSVIAKHALLCIELASWDPEIVKYPAVLCAAAGLLSSWTLSNEDVPNSIGLHVLCELCRVSRVDLVRCEALMIDLVKRPNTRNESKEGQ